MTTRTEQDSALIQELLDEIESSVVNHDWQLPLDYVLSLLDLSREEYYRYVYAEQAIGNWSDHMPDAFSAESMVDLVALLEHQGLRRAGELFHKAGYYFSEEHLLNWLEFFHSVTLSRMQSHAVDAELLETAMAGCQRFLDAVEFYGHCHFDEREYINFATKLYLEHAQIEDHSLSREILGGFIRREFHQRNLIWEHLYRTIYGTLRDAAVQLELPGADQIDGEEHARRSGGGAYIDPELATALRTLELPTEPLPEPEVVKKQYRQMLKRYHPDVNPEGQEQTRDLIGAYGVVVSHLGLAEQGPP